MIDRRLLLCEFRLNIGLDSKELFVQSVFNVPDLVVQLLQREKLARHAAHQLFVDVVDRPFVEYVALAGLLIHRCEPDFE
jgi:hypothetical protein